jgi:xanthine dehydrogenase accessory factor
LKRATLDRILESRDRRRSIVRLVWLADGRERLVSSARDFDGDGDGDGAVDVDDDLSRAIDETLSLTGDRGRLVETSDGPVFVHPYSPSLRLAIVGAVHIAQPLSGLARDLGYRVTMIDPRQGFLTEARFPGMSLCHEWPDVALERLELDERCALVTLSHDPKIDNPALEVGLRSSCFYIGALGSRRTQERRRKRLREAGFDDLALARIHGPVGLDIGARSPAEIAVSIAAEMTQCLRRAH